MYIDDVLSSSKDISMKDFWLLKKLAWNLHFYSGGNVGHTGAWLSQIPQKRFHYLKYILSTDN